MEPMLEAFQQFIRTLEGTVIIHFKHLEMKKKDLLAITEILPAKYPEHIREFEVPYTRAAPLLKHYHLFENPTAMLFLNGNVETPVKGYRAVREYLRRLLLPAK